MLKPLILLAACIPLAFLFAVVLYQQWLRKRKGERSPLTEKLLRPAGYGLQCKIESLNESFDFWLMVTVALSLSIVFCLIYVATNTIGRAAFLIFLGIPTIACCIFAWRRLEEMRSSRRGLLGEQAVAEELQLLAPEGYRIFHDIPGDGKWNIDHVAVGPAGVFAIETKYRRKKPGEAGKEDHKAVFDGAKVQFPSGYDTEAPEQAKRNARWLANFLSKATGERVTAQPIVALPGWYVTLTANSDVKVLSGKQISGFISSEPARLSDKTIKQIIYQLDQRCRDVEI